MRRFLKRVGVSVLLATCFSYAQTPQLVPAIDNEFTGAWLVELSSPPTDEGTPLETLDREEAAFHSAAAATGVQYIENRHFRKLWNGLAVRASATEVPKLRALPGVQSVYPVVRVQLQQAEQEPGPGADLVSAIRMTFQWSVA